MKKVILVGTAGMLVCLVLVVVPAMATEAPEGWKRYEIRWGDTLSELAWQILIENEVQNPIDKIGAVVEMIQAENESIVSKHLIYAWTEIAIPTPEALPELLAKRGIIPEKRAGPTGEELRTKIELLEKILVDQSVVLEEKTRKIEQLQEMEATRTELEGRVKELENTNFWYWRFLILAGLIIVVLAVVLGEVIKSELKGGKELEEAEREGDELQKKLDILWKLRPGNKLVIGGKEFEIVKLDGKPQKDIGEINTLAEAAQELGAWMKCSECKKNMLHKNTDRHQCRKVKVK